MSVFWPKGLVRLSRRFLPVAACIFAALAPASAIPASPVSADIAQYRGKVVYLDFWATWCAPCRQSFGFLNRLRAMHGNSDFVILTVNLDKDRNAAGNFLRSVSTGLPVIYDPQGTIASRYKVSIMPTSLVIGRDGRVLFQHRGFFENHEGEYEAHVAAALSARP
jgi:cytochrome c biogenesis protein CcmG, thiol:disulfide interchange protein DsbE